MCYSQTLVKIPFNYLAINVMEFQYAREKMEKKNGKKYRTS
jgi:hypothetical protein